MAPPQLLIATTSAGFAFSRGLSDGAVKRDDMLAHIRELVDATDLPVNADFENGYADDPNDVAESVKLCVATGVAGLSIEDATDRKESRLYEIDLAVERIKATREAIGESGRINHRGRDDDGDHSGVNGNDRQLLVIGHTRHFGFLAEQTSAPKSISA